MPFLDGKQVYELLATNNSEDLPYAYALRCLVQTASYPTDYTADSRWQNAVTPTDAGEELLRRVSALPIPRGDLLLALFGLFWFQEPLVDANRSDLALIRSLVADEARRRRLLWPFSHGRLLYDRYATLFPDMRDAVTAQEWPTLLLDTPQGIYQAGKLLTGPLGILDSSCVRFFPPSQVLGLLHCPMLECGRLHPVRLVPPAIPLTEGYRLLESAATALWNTRSRWENTLSCWPYPPQEGWRAYSDMPLFLGNCIVGADRTRLLEAALSSTDGDQIRSVLKSTSAKGGPAKIAESIDSEAQLQLLLTLADDKIKNLIDNLVWNNNIEVPAGEVREVEPEKYAYRRAPIANSLQLSSLGIRVTSQHPVLRLRSVVWNAYLQNNEATDLEWRLRKAPGVEIEHALMDYLRATTPAAAIETLVLTSQRITRAVAQALETEIQAPDERARSILLWKLGFDLPRADGYLPAIMRALDEFAATVSRVGIPKTDSDRQVIRSAGVNAFVELEGFAQELIAYLVWLLCSDHPKSTRFVYSRAVAMLCVPNALGAELISASEKIQWKATGNTLGTCVRYLQQLANWIEALPKCDRAAHLRAPDEIQEPPSNSVTAFPFRHVQLWADANPDSLASLAATVAACSSSINRGEVAAVRNSLEHYREVQRFPSSDRILSTVEAIRDFFWLAHRERLYPRLFWLAGSAMDSFGQTKLTFTDSVGETVLVHTPRTVRGLPPVRRLSVSRPLLIAPANLFGLPNADLLLGVRPESVYSRYWADYPIYRSRVVFSPEEDSTSLTELQHHGTDAAQQGVAADGSSPRS